VKRAERDELERVADILLSAARVGDLSPAEAYVITRTLVRYVPLGPAHRALVSALAGIMVLCGPDWLAAVGPGPE